jgi:hypothetical protein
MPSQPVPEVLKQELRKAKVAQEAGARAKTMPSPTYAPPGRSRWLWAIIAIIAATVGVVIGAIIGTR